MKSSVFQRIMNRLSREWKKITFSFLLSIVLWFSLARFSYIEKKVYLPITYRNLPDGYVILEKYDENAWVLIKAKEDFFDNSNISNYIKPVVYLDKATKGVNLYPIELVLNTPIQDVSVKLLKNEVKLRIDSIYSNYLEIRPAITGIPVKGYFIEEVKLEKDKILTSGPENLLSNLKFVQTEPILVDNISNSFTTNIKLITPEFCDFLEGDDVTVQVIIKKLTPELNKTNTFNTNM